MAAPPNVTTKSLSGKFTWNKSLGDSAEEILRLQGVSWFKRRAISLFTPTLCIKHTIDEHGVEHINIEQTLSGGLPGTLREEFPLDWQERDEDHDLFGPVTGKSHRIPIEDIPDEFLNKDWTQDTIDNGIILTDYSNTPHKNSRTWSALQTWGFAMVNEERRYVRRTTFTSPEKQDGPIHVRFVYDYIGAIESIDS